MTGSSLEACPRPLCEAYDVALLDLDGVVYVGRHGAPHAPEAIRAAGDRGMRLAFVTNNASRSPDDVAAHLVELGVPATADDVVTSGQAAVHLVADRVPPGSAVLVLGSAALADQVRAAGLLPVRTVAEAGRAGPAAVVQGLEPQTSWSDLAEAAVAVRAGAVWVAGNTDATLPSPRGPLPGNGAMVAALRTATGAEPLVAGKPEPALHRESVQRTRASRPLVVGDRLETDVLGAVRAGAPSLLVLTGVVDLPALLAAPAGCRPSFVAPDLRGLLVDQPAVEVRARGASCGAARVCLDGGTLRLEWTAGTSSGDVAEQVSGLRAMCAVAWAVADQGDPVPSVDAAALAG